MTDDALAAAADDLVAHLARLGPDVRVVRRLIAADGSGTRRFGMISRTPGTPRCAALGPGR